MNFRKLQLFKHIFVCVFCFGILTQSGVKAPVLCFETDGDINLEVDCDISCKVPEPKEKEHQDDCDNCVDIHLWNYTPDLAFTINQTEIDFVDFSLIQLNSFALPNLKNQPKFILVETKVTTLPPFIKTTVLLA